MGMRGELGIFSAAEILQLIGSQEKSGVLQVRSKGRTAVLFFDSGKIISARDRRQSVSDPFLTYLLENGEITIQDLHKVLESKKADGGDVIEIMLREKLADDAKLGELLSQYALQIVTNIVKWEAGTYEFMASCDGMPDKALGEPLRLEPILMEALRRKDEVEEITRFLPSLETRLDVAEPNWETLPLEENDLALMRLVDGSKTIDEIIELSAADEVEALDILEKLFALGIVSIAAETPQAERTRQIGVRKAVAIAVAALVVSVGLRFAVLSPGPASERPAGALKTTVAQFTQARDVETLRLALDAYKSLKGTYPDRLQDLVGAKLIRADVIHDRYGKPYPYQHVTADDSYLLAAS